MNHFEQDALRKFRVFEREPVVASQDRGSVASSVRSSHVQVVWGLRSRWRLDLKMIMAIMVSLGASVLTSGWEKLDAQEQAAKAEAVPDEIDFFERRIRPLLDRHCFECHAGDERAGGLRLDSAMGVLEGGDTGPAVVPGDVDKSLLLKAVRYDDPEFSMPPSGKLTASEISDLEQWIAGGAFDPREATANVPSKGVPGPGMSIADGLKFWSLQRVVEPVVPDTADPWVKTPIDAFVLNALEAEGLSPAAKASREVLIKRLKYDLLGLPPSIDEVTAFVNDARPDAYRRLVDRYLSSEQYGVRWGRHWLDVARYADSNGLDENLAFGNAWRYRDYVVHAFNSDKPYSDFVTEQLAGDLSAPNDRDAITATGFLVLGAKVLAEPDREKLEMDTIDEQLDTTGKVFLGMSLGCVRCHDHKFDPITQADYYALAAVFKSTRTFGETNTGAIKHWNEKVFADEKQLEAMKAVDEQIAALKKAAADFKNQAYSKLRQEVRERAVDYLVEATAVDLQMSLTEVAKIAEPKGLHPRVLYHCRKHLQFHSEDPVFAPWHQMKGDDHGVKVRDFYQDRVIEALRDKSNAGNESASEEVSEASRFEEKELADLKAALMDNSGFLAVPPKPDFAFDVETYAEYDRLMEKARLFESAAPDVDSVMSVQDGDVVSELAIHVRGSHRNLGKPVAKRVPEVMQAAAGDVSIEGSHSGRLELARWMTSGHHPLTSRVQVNRIWGWHFGAGLVRTTENFGVLGSRASHPELLDWLAFQYVENGWSTKQLQRTILLSSVYQQDSRHADFETASNRDPDNRLLWRYPTRRLEAEQLHDAILAVCDQLDESLDGKTVPLRNRQFVFNHTSEDHTKYDSPRRAIYLPVIRNNLYTTFEQFDFPDPTMPTGSRSVTTVAPQALLLMNSPMVVDAATHLAHRLVSLSLSDASRIEKAFQCVLGREPEGWEIDASITLLNRVKSQSSEESILHWSVLCQSLLAANEFIYIQ